MPTYTFRGRDMTEAVEQVRVMLGSEAVIIDTLRGTDHIGRFVEITATGELRTASSGAPQGASHPHEPRRDERGAARRGRGAPRGPAQPPRMGPRSGMAPPPRGGGIEPPSRREFEQTQRAPRPQVRRPSGTHVMPPELALLSDGGPKQAVKGAERYVHPNSFSSEREPIIPQPASHAYAQHQAQHQAHQRAHHAAQPSTMYNARRNAYQHAERGSRGGRVVTPTPQRVNSARSVHAHQPASHPAPLAPPIQRRVVPEEATMTGHPANLANAGDYDPRGVDPWGLEQQNAPAASPSTSPNASPLGQSVMAVQNLVSQAPGGGGNAIQFVTERLNEIVQYIQSGQPVQGMPAPVFEHLNQFQRQLESTGIEGKYAEDLIEQTKARIRLNQLDKQVILAHLGQVLAQNLDCINPLTPPPNTEKNVLAFIGPTGVGKTTTIAKIAAHAQLTHETPVTLISTDTFRMAAVEQLSRYASILDCPALAAHTPEELWKHIDEADTPLVLVDTTGRNPKTQGQLKALAELFGEGWNGRTVLTVAANTREQDLRPIVEGFSPLKYNMVAVTKLDETYALGTVYNVSKFTNCPISWTTNGQRVPEDIELANSEMLAVKIIMEAISHKV